MKKLIIVFMLIVLCAAMASPAMAVQKESVYFQNMAVLTDGWTGTLEIMEGTDDWWRANKDDPIETYYYGAHSLNQHFLNSEAEKNQYVGNMKLIVFSSNGASNFDGCRVWFNFEDLGMTAGDTVKALYGRYNEHYTNYVTNYVYYEPISASVTLTPGNSNGDFYVDIPEFVYNIPLLIAAKKTTGGNTQPDNPDSQGGSSAKIPETGDASAPILWLCMMTLAGAGMLMLRRRKHN